MRFEDLVDVDGVAPEDSARLRRVHDLLVQAGPPPDLPPALERPPSAPPEAEVVQFPLMPRRRWALAAVAAAAVALIAFGGGYLTGHAKKKATSFDTRAVVPMQPQHGSGALALLHIASRDNAGNTPMLLEVNNLPTQKTKGDYYELWLTRNGKAIAPCGSFRVNRRTTTVRLSVPYDFKSFEGWVVTRQTATHHTPGPVVLST
jgi:Anti-sigma-K factor rskA